jgi:hypothetical protein
LEQNGSDASTALPVASIPPPTVPASATVPVVVGRVGDATVRAAPVSAGPTLNRKSENP